MLLIISVCVYVKKRPQTNRQKSRINSIVLYWQDYMPLAQPLTQDHWFNSWWEEKITICCLIKISITPYYYVHT